MSNKAFDIETNKKVYASDCVSSYKGRYLCCFCKNNGKTVPVFIREKDEKKAFVSYDKNEHLSNCDFSIKQEYINAYSPLFTRESLFERLLQQPHKNNTESKSSGIQVLSHGSRPTLKWLYNVCTTNENTYEFATGCTIENSCLKKDTLKYWYDKDKTKYPLLIIGSISRYTPDELLIQLSIGKYKINVFFSNKTIMSEFLKECRMVNGQTIGTEVYLFGQLTNPVKSFQKVTVYSQKQIKIKR